MIRSLVLILAPQAPLANDLKISGISIRSFGPLKPQNMSTGDDFIDSIGITISVPFLTPREAVEPLKNDSFMLGRSIW